MIRKNKKKLILKRLSIWILYLFSGFILYSKEGYLFPSLVNFAKMVYPLSIFWLQIRLKRKGNLLSIDSSMTTSQLWFNIIPVLASFFTVIFSISNLILFFIQKLSNF